MSNLIGSELPLVERLRKMKGMGDYQLAALMDGVGPQAADEIERLQREVEVQAYWGERWVQQHAECQQLREALRDLNHALWASPSCQKGAIDRCRCVACASERARGLLPANAEVSR